MRVKSNKELSNENSNECNKKIAMKISNKDNNVK